jgi:hypothetical protein
MDKRAYLKRIAALQARTTSTVIVCTMRDNTNKTIKRNKLLEICNRAVDGISSPETETLLASVADNSGTRLIELLKMLF